MKYSHISSLISSFANTERMPVLFLGHGSPMNAIEENEFVAGFRNIVKDIPTPKAILCISAHWETRGTKITAQENPPTIHDFGGFPQALFDVQYPAPGEPELAEEIKNTIQQTEIILDSDWGLDHGAWSVIKHLYPTASIPVIQLSLNIYKTPQEHYALAKELQFLRQKGVLIIGSGNMVHNLKEVAWDKMNQDNYAYDWAKIANEQMKDNIIHRNINNLINFRAQGKEWKLAIPTAEHYLPLLYALGSSEGKGTQIEMFNDKAVAGSLTMTSFKFQ